MQTRRLNKKYGVSVVKIKETLDAAKTADDALGKSLRDELDQIKQAKLEELKKLAKKKRGMKVDPDQIIPRFSPAMLHKTFLAKLGQKVYANKGYVLDGFPRDYLDACELFLDIPKPPAATESGEQPEEEERNYEEYKSVAGRMPNKVILLEGTIRGDNTVSSERRGDDGKGERDP